jgi:hypothetical protein
MRACSCLISKRISTRGSASRLDRGSSNRNSLGCAPAPGSAASSAPRHLPSSSPQRAYSEATIQTIDRLVQDLVQKAFRQASEILREQIEIFHRSAKELLAKETLSAEKLTILTGMSAPPDHLRLRSMPETHESHPRPTSEAPNAIQPRPIWV